MAEGETGRRLQDASATLAAKDYKEERKDRWVEDTRSQWGLMITFDLINERKIEVRQRMYWFSQDELSMARFWDRNSKKRGVGGDK